MVLVLICTLFAYLNEDVMSRKSIPVREPLLGSWVGGLVRLGNNLIHFYISFSSRNSGWSEVLPELSSLVLGLNLSRGGRGGRRKWVRSGRNNMIMMTLIKMLMLTPPGSGGGGRKGKWWKGRGKGDGSIEVAELVGEVVDEEVVEVCKMESIEKPDAAQRL